MLSWESGKNKIQVTLVNDKAQGFAGQFEVNGGIMKMQN